MSWNWVFRRVFPSPLARLLWPVHIVGLDNLPRRGPYILALGPHTTEIESVIVASALNQFKIQFFAMAEYWNKSWLHAWFMTHSGQIPLSRTDSRAAVLQIGIGADVLREGGIVAMYPEGTRNKSGESAVHQGHTGVVRTSLRAGGVPIVPVGLVDMSRLGFTKFGRSTMIIGKPIIPKLSMADPEKYPKTEKALEAVLSRPVTDTVMHEIARLSTHPYIGTKLQIPGRT
jgi:1-acyl-sn-glycerol-3-phosphate acyltransferase